MFPALSRKELIIYAYASIQTYEVHIFKGYFLKGVKFWNDGGGGGGGISHPYKNAISI